jgi:hypothetical protein
MKTNLKFVAAGIIAGATSLYLAVPLMAAVGSPLYGVEKKAVFGPEKFSISLSQVSNSGKINLHVEKGNNVSLTVTLRNANGDVVNEYSIKKTETDYSQNYDFSQAEEGLYKLVVSDGHQTVTKEIKYEQPKTVILAKFIIN